MVQTTACLSLGSPLSDRTCSRLDGLGGVDSHIGYLGSGARHQRRLLCEDGPMGEEGKGRKVFEGYSTEPRRCVDGESIDAWKVIPAWYTRCGSCGCGCVLEVGIDDGGYGDQCDGQMASGCLTECAMDDPWSLVWF